MSETRPEKRKIEFIESYWTGGIHGGDYQWNDNHGELIRCKDCVSFKGDKPVRWCSEIKRFMGEHGYCSFAKRKCEDG